MAQDSDALAHGLSVSMMPVVGEAGFSWNDYANIDPRYDFTDLTKMYTSLGAEFEAASEQRLEIDSAAATAYPISAGCWVKSSTTAEQTALWIGNKDSADEWMRIGIDSSGNAFLGRIASGGGEDVTVGANIDDGSWHFIMAVCTSATDVDLYVDAVAAVNDTTSVVFANFDRTSVGRSADSTPTAYFNGSIDNVLVFDTTALTAAQVSWIQTNKPAFDELSSSTDTDNPGTTNCAMAIGLDEHSGVRMDESGNGLHLVPAGSAKGVTFESTDGEYASVDTAAATAVGFTMGGSFKSGATAEQIGIWIGNKDTDDEFTRIGLSSAGDAILERQASGGGKDTATGANIDDDAWHWMAAVITAADDVDLYVDAVAAVNDVTSVVVANFDRTAIGAHAGSTLGSFFDGEMDNLWVYTAALSAANLTWLRTGGLTGGPAAYDDVRLSNHADNPGTSNLAAWYKLNEAARTIDGPVTLVNVHNPGTHDLTTAGVAKGIKFELSDSEIATSATTPVTTPVMSITCSFKSSTATTWQGLLTVGAASNDKRMIAIRNDDKLVAYARNSVGISAAASVANVTDGAWHFGAAVFNTSTPFQEIYLDSAAGVEETTERAPDAAYSDIAMAMTNPSGAASNPSDATIDNVALWSAVLSAPQVGFLQSGGYGGQAATYWDVVNSTNASNPGTTDLECWYELSEATGAATLVNRHNPGTHDLTTSSGGAGPTTATGDVVSYPDTAQTGVVTDLPVAVAGTVSVQAEVGDGALEFDGVDQECEAASSPAFSFPFSLSCWFRMASAPASASPLLSFDDGTSDQIRLSIETSGKATLTLRFNNGTARSVTSVPVVSDGDLHFLLGVVTSATDYDLYVDDVSAVSGSNDVGGLPAVAVTNIGSRLALFSKAVIDECAIFNVALDATDRTALYNLGIGLLNDSASLPSGAIHYWNLSKNNAGGAGEDQVGSLDLTLAGTTDPVDSDGIPAGQAEHGLVSLVDNAQVPGTNQLTQATLSKRPEVVSVADGTGYALKFDGLDDVLQSSAFSGALSQPNTLMLLVDITDNSADQGLIDGIVGTSEQSLQVNSTGDLLRIDGGTAASTTIGADYGTMHALVGVFNGASSVVYQDGGTGETESAGAETMTGVTIGALQDGTTEPAKGIYRQAVVNNEELTAAQLNQIGGQWQADHGITWTNI